MPSLFSTITNENFGYDKNGNKIYDDQNGDIRKYTYDGLNRLTGAEIGNVRTEYEFDNFNNISREYEIIGARIEKKTYYYDNANRLLLEDSNSRTVQYEYDNSGNLIKKITGIGNNAETAHYRYDGYNRLSEFIDNYSTAEYEYNINGLRESKTVNGTKTRYIYNGADIIGEIFDDNIYTYYRATELIGYKNNKGDRYYYRQNSHGDVTALLTIDGQEKKTYSYNAYGKENPLSLSSMGGQTSVLLWKAEIEKVHNPFRYCGEYQDLCSGLIYLRNRYYDNSIGRFITEDPINDGLNWYVYCGNNPVNYVDPLGLNTEDRYVVGDSVRLRNGIGLDAGIIDTLSKGTKVDFSGNRSGWVDGYIWAEVTYNGHTGWIASAFLGIIPPGSTNIPSTNIDIKITKNSIDIQSIQKEFQSVGDFDRGYGLQCVDLTKWFINDHTTLQYARGNGCDQAGNVAKTNGLPAPTSTPQGISVFSVQPYVKAFGASGGKYGHTGIVLSVDDKNKTVTVIHTWNGLEKHSLNSVISTYSYPVNGVYFTNIEEYLK